MQNAALKIAKSPLPVANKPARYTLHLFHTGARRPSRKEDPIACLLRKEQSCCDCATD